MGGGEVHLICNSRIPQPTTLHALETPKISAVRGIAYCTRVSPSVVNRMIETARGILRPTGVEVNITADVWRGDKSGNSPGFGLLLVAELKRGWRILTDGVGAPGSLPEDLAETVSYQLLDELTKSSVVGRYQLPLALGFMSIGKEDIGRLKVHKEQIDESLIWILRDLKSICDTEAFLKEDDEDDYYTVSIKGTGFTNASKKVT